MSFENAEEKSNWWYPNEEPLLMSFALSKRLGSQGEREQVVEVSRLLTEVFP
jgi:hypothetical protein